MTRICGRVADRDTGLDRGADVVGVHMAVPEAVAAHDDDRVAERVPRARNCGIDVIRRVEEEHHFVARTPATVRGPVLPPVAPTAPGLTGGSGSGATVEHVQPRVEAEREPMTAGIDDARAASTGSNSGVRSTDACASPATALEQRDE